MTTMTKAGKNILKALAFANADNHSEFRVLLNKVDHKDISATERTPHKPAPRVSDIPVITPAVHSM